MLLAACSEEHFFSPSSPGAHGDCLVTYMAASPAHTSGDKSVGHMGPFACALCDPQGHQLHNLPRPASATGSSPARSKHLRATKSPATSSRQRRMVLVEPPLRLLHLLRADGREALVLQRAILAGVTKIRTFLDYKWLNSTCLFFLAHKWSQPLLQPFTRY